MKVPLATKIDISTSDDAESTAIVAETKAGKVAFAIKNKQLSNLMAVLLEQSQKVAVEKLAIAVPQESQRMTIAICPVQLSGVGIGKGRTESERVLHVEVGNLTLAFWVGASAIHELCGDLPQLDELESPRRPH